MNSIYWKDVQKAEKEKWTEGNDFGWARKQGQTVPKLGEQHA